MEVKLKENCLYTLFYAIDQVIILEDHDLDYADDLLFVEKT